MSLTLSMAMDPSLSSVRKAASIFREAIADLGAAGVRQELELAFVEACTNSAKHGSSGKAGDQIKVTLEIQSSQVKVTLEDHGRPFDPAGQTCVIDAQRIEALPTGGMGLPLIRAIFDSVEYEPLPGRNRLVLVKRIPGNGGVARKVPACPPGATPAEAVEAIEVMDTTRKP